jgi:hypothetical protein
MPFIMIYRYSEVPDKEVIEIYKKKFFFKPAVINRQIDVTVVK